MRALSWPLMAIGSCVCCACGAAAAPERPPASARTEIVVDEATVVRADAPSLPPFGLPPLPTPLPETSMVFQHGLTLAQALLEAPAPSAAPDDSAGYATWLDSDFKPWMQARAEAVAESNAALGASANGSLAERVVGAAVTGMVDARTHDQLLAVPAPPEVRGDDDLLRIYQNAIRVGAATWVEQALTSLRDCADHAARATDSAFVPWLDLCQARMSDMQRAQAEAQALFEQVAADRAAEPQAQCAAPMDCADPGGL